MTKHIKNIHTSEKFWDRNFTRDELRKIASHHGIRRGKNKQDTIYNLIWGRDSEGRFTIVFYVAVWPMT